MVAEVLIEMRQMLTRITRLEDAVHEVRNEISGMRAEAQANADRLIDALTKNTSVMIERRLNRDDQLKNHEGRPSNLENPPR